MDSHGPRGSQEVMIRRIVTLPLPSLVIRLGGGGDPVKVQLQVGWCGVEVDELVGDSARFECFSAAGGYRRRIGSIGFCH